MKRSELFFNIVSIPVDIISLILAGLASFYIRINLGSYIPIIFSLNINSFIRIFLGAIPGLLIIFTLAGLYNLRGTRRFANELVKIIGAISIALLIVIIIFFFNQAVFPSRLIILVSWVLSIIFVALGRFILKQIQITILKRGTGLHRLAIINGPKSEWSLIETMKNNKNLGYKVVAELSDPQSLMQDLEQLYQRQHIEEILQANPNLPEDLNLKLVQFARSKGLIFNFVPNLFNVQRNIIDSDTIDGIPVISLKNTPLDGWGKVVKRGFDVLASSICLIITSPLFLILSILIKLDSRGRVLYSAPRVGNGHDFTFYKFRTMYSHLSVGMAYGGYEAEKVRQELWKVNARGGAGGPFLKIKNDPRVTKIGRFLRKTKLDEIPSFINVLRGDMSMVGPRAHVVDEVDRYKNQYARMFTIMPGIFGSSQIAQLSWPDLPFEEEIRLNTFYIENWSLWMDISILAKSFWYLFISPKTDY